MRRIFALVLGLMLLMIPAVVGAQDNQLIWDLDGVYTVSDLGFKFPYPKTWVTDSSNGIRLAENDADLAAVMDSDAATQPEGYTISLNALPLETLGVEAGATLDTVVDALVEATGITETESRIEVPVLSRRAITVIGTDASERNGLATVWVQDGYVVVFGLGGPELSSDVGFTWGTILGASTPLDALTFSEKPFTAQSGKFTMDYPEGWFTDEGIGGITENEADLTSVDAPTGVAFSVAERNIADIAPDATDLAGVLAVAAKQLGWDQDPSIVASENVVLGQPALTMTGPAPTAEGAFLAVTVTMLDEETVLTIATFYPSEEHRTSFAPTRLAMIKSIKLVEAS